MDTFETITGGMLETLEDYNFWVLGLDRNGHPRQGFTPEECQERKAQMPTKGKLEDLRTAVEQAKPRCEVCGLPSNMYVRDMTYERDFGSMTVRRIIAETHFYCGAHTREAVSRYEVYH